MIGDFRRVCQENIFGFEIAMNYPLAVKIAQASQYLSDDDSAIKLLDSILSINKGHEIPSCSEFGEDEA